MENCEAGAIKRKRILIISANPLDECSNNGKTLLSFFGGYPVEDIAQLYFYPTLPGEGEFDNYFCITDFDILNKRLGKTNFAGGRVRPVKDANEKTLELKKMYSIKKGAGMRLAREALWGNTWKSRELDCWLDEFNPDCIFFMAGDGVFAYKICEYIRQKYKTKLIMYITDDYILPREKWNVAWRIRRNYIMRYMRTALEHADLFLTISDKMRQVYKELFQKDSFVAVNMVESMRVETFVRQRETNATLLVYTGGLQFNRDKTLHKLAKAIQRINEQGAAKLFLEVYSGAMLDEKREALLNVEHASRLCGKLDADGVKRKLNEADILVHVESFEKQNIADTKLSLSTKIPEYMSVGKPIVAIGPDGIASMEYLRDASCCITDEREIEKKLTELIADTEMQQRLAETARKKYLQNHVRDVQKAKLWAEIDKI